MSQTKRKVKIRQHIAQLHIKTQAVNCPNFKRKKAEPSETKTFKQLNNELVALLNTCDLEEIDAFEKSMWVSEAERNKLQGIIEMKTIKIEALQLAIMTIYNPRIKILVGENAKLKTEVEQLKAVRDALGISNKNALADRNTFIKKAEGFEGENAKLLKRIEKLYRLNAEIHTERSNLRERLEAIRKHYEKLPTWKEARQKSTATNKVEEEQIPAHLILIDMWNAWARERGVLLSEPKSEAETK